MLACALALFLLRPGDGRTGDVVARTEAFVPAPRPPAARSRGPAEPVTAVRPPPSSSTTPLPRAADTPVAALPDAIPGEEVMTFYDDIHLRRFLELAAEEGLEVMGRIGRLRAVRLRVGDGAALRRVLARAPSPLARAPNGFVRQPEPPTPPEGVVYRSFDGAGPDWMGIGKERSDWGRGIKVAVLDSAAAHGKAVASIIAGRGAEVRGVAPGADLLALTVLNDDGVGDTFTLAGAVVEAVDGGARVLNISLGAMGDSPVLREAVAYARQAGAVVVAAAGNDGREGILYPARYPGVLSVGAVDADGRQLYFSNRGATLDLVAPGLGVKAAGGDDTPVLFSGTSAAAPFVAGAAAGIWSEEPELTGTEVEQLLVSYADDAGAPGRDDRYGAGIINVGRVLERATPGLVDMVVVPPYVERHPLYADELTVTLFGQNRGTERLARVVLTAVVDGAPVERTFYDVGVGEIVRQDMRLTHAGIGDRIIEIRQSVRVEDADDRSPLNNEMRSSLALESSAPGS